MIDFLKVCGISDDDILEIAKNNEYSLDALSDNRDNCIKIIVYMKNMGIKNIDELLMYRISLFLLTFDEFVEKFSKVVTGKLIEEINCEFFAIDKIF